MNIKKISKFAILYLSMNVILFLLTMLFAIPILHSWWFLIANIFILIGLSLVIQKDLIKFNRIFILLPFYIIGVFVFLISLLGSIQYLYQVMLISYFVVTTWIIWTRKTKKLFWVPVVILIIQCLLSFSALIPSKNCSFGYKGGIIYSCDCEGLERHHSGGNGCIGKRTCYKYAETIQWIPLGSDPEKIKTDCAEIDNYYE